MSPNVVVIIPAYNEQDSIAKVIAEIPREWINEIVVVSNGSTDETESRAEQAGATVLKEPKRGYGQACLTGIAHVAQSNPDIVVFLDGDHSDFPGQMPDLIRPISEQGFDMVIGSRALGSKENGSMTPQQVFGNALATRLMRLFYGVKYTDLGPFRAIRFDRLMQLGMQDRNYGWTIEMQLKAAKKRYKTCEVPVDYRRRIGVSKVSGTLKGTIMAGYKILTAIFRYL
jgi:glycosyltransferase involved in cell wall biosynthesis